jgi:FAD-linked sulfhydryl oxidase
MAGSLSKELGPGVWGLLHSTASDPSKFQELRSLVNIIASSFPCKDCREHFQELLKQMPLHPSIQYGLEKESPLGWTWTAHNAVNVRIGKPVYPWEDCKRTWSPGGPECDSCSRTPNSSYGTPVAGFGTLAKLPPPKPTPRRW